MGEGPFRFQVMHILLITVNGKIAGHESQQAIDTWMHWDYQWANNMNNNMPECQRTEEQCPAAGILVILKHQDAYPKKNLK